MSKIAIRFKRGDRPTAKQLNSIIKELPSYNNVNPGGLYRDCGNGQVILRNKNISVGNAVAATARTALRPFAVRWMNTSKTDKKIGEWQIYLPIGCATVNDIPYAYVNDKAKDINGEDIPGWYKLPEPEDEDADITNTGKYKCKEWTVYFRAKPYPLSKAGTQREDDEFTEQYKIAVAAIQEKTFTGEGGVEKKTRSAVQYRTEQYSVTNEQDEWFKIVYEVNGDKTKESSYTAYLVNQFVQFGRSQVWQPSKTNITEYTDVVVEINHSGVYPTITITGEYQTDSRDKTYIKILEMKDKVVKTDLRSSIRRSLNLYTN